MIASAENVELTKQLGKTVLYGDIALSPDGRMSGLGAIDSRES